MLSSRKEKQFLFSFMNDRDVPAWYRGTSPFQTEAADELANSIRDDSAQETSHRVRNCLNRLGLIPAVHDKDLKMLMKLSGGNDLAFLWFLMELYYKMPGDEYSSLNEQLILTSIAHLDMVTTLRELDNILPPGHASKRQLEKRRKQRLRDKSWQGQPQKLSKKHSSPYFNKLERPVQYGKPLEVERPDFKVKFFRYEIYKDPNYVPPNEENRWYARHVFNSAKRISNITIRDVLNNLGDHFDLIPSISNRALEVINYALSMHDMKNMKNKVLCKKHQDEEEEARLRRTRFILKQREKCVETLPLFRKKKEAQRERIQKMLDTDVEMYRLHYQKQLRSHKGDQTYIRLLDKDGYCEHLIEDDQEENCSPIGPCPGTPSLLSMVASHISRYAQLSDSKLNELSKVESLLMNRTHRLSFGQRDSQRYQYLNTTPTPPSSERYFVGPTDNKPYHFSYTKIFRYKDENDKRIFIKEKCVEAMENKEPHIPKLDDLTPDLAKLAKKSADQTWDENKEEMLQADVNNVLQESPLPVDPYPPDMPRLPFYDCEDTKLMNEMLRIALVHMRKNPKYVLASLPDADKLPMLREWIYQRYGKRYTRAQRIKELNNSIKIMNVLQKLKLRAVLPKSTEIGTQYLQSYKCHKYIMKKVGIARRQFYDRVNSDLLKRARFFWFALRISLCALPTRATFFAYLPARQVDNYIFKPWKLSERMEAKAEWEKRRTKAPRDK
uniref:tRNA pseudouridine synthase B n=3 Tax=Zeugodacus cucurbitae TaxID=28588 RepID=A0A0A1XSI6_ZEUCU